MKRLLIVLLVVVVAVAPWSLRAQGRTRHSYTPPRGFVPDSLTAVRIATAIWIPIYGEAQIRAESPYVAKLKGDVWMVTGTLPPNHVGGVAEADIAKRDARIVRVSHGL